MVTIKTVLAIAATIAVAIAILQLEYICKIFYTMNIILSKLTKLTIAHDSNKNITSPHLNQG